MSNVAISCHQTNWHVTRIRELAHYNKDIQAQTSNKVSQAREMKFLREKVMTWHLMKVEEWTYKCQCDRKMESGGKTRHIRCRCHRC
ncbi:MAG: hypothetical protein ACOH5I_12270 [Oligoflexus sp.]